MPNVLRQSLQLIAKMPLLAVYAYQAYRHYKLDGTLMIKNPKKGYSTAENILYMLRDDGQFSELEAKVLDICLVLHAEHGGGNNSTFTTHVVTSSGTDSAISASIASLKGPKHGGANLKVQKMFADIEANCKDWEDREEVCAYLNKILDKEAFDKAGLIYGMGHAVYTNSDPREVILKRFAKRLSEEKGMQREFALYELVEKEAGELIMHKRKLFKPVCANVDFYSGFVCWESRKNYLLRFLRLQEFQDGVHTAWKNLLMQERLSVRHISMWDITDHTAQCRIEMKENSRDRRI